MAYSFFKAGTFNELPARYRGNCHGGIFSNFLYPMLASVSFYFSQHFYVFVKLLNALLMNAVIFPVFFISKEFIDSNKAFLVSIIPLFFPFINLGNYFLTESLCFPLFLTAFYLSNKLFETLRFKYIVFKKKILASEKPHYSTLYSLRQLLLFDKQREHLLLHITEMKKSFVHFLFQGIEGRKIMEMDFLFLDLFPQFFNRVVVRGSFCVLTVYLETEIPKFYSYHLLEPKSIPEFMRNAQIHAGMAIVGEISKLLDLCANNVTLFFRKSTHVFSHIRNNIGDLCSMFNLWDVTK